MTDITVFEQNGKLMTDSREVAMMIDKPHNDLMKSIRSYIDHLNEGDFSRVDFFIDDTYIDGKGETRPCYLCTKKGCDMIANKLSGRKGTIFTAQYVSAFDRMQSFIKDGKQISNAVPFAEYIKSIEVVAGFLKVNDASKLLMLDKAYGSFGLPTEFLPKYELNGSRDLAAATALLKKTGAGISAIKFNERMLKAGLLEKKSRKGSNGDIKYYNALTDAGLKFGENAISPQNQRETQPLYYADSFDHLFGTLGMS
jgi:Rha family phage regulatory protein